MATLTLFGCLRVVLIAGGAKRNNSRPIVQDEQPKMPVVPSPGTDKGVLAPGAAIETGPGLYTPPGPQASGTKIFISFLHCTHFLFCTVILTVVWTTCYTTHLFLSRRKSSTNVYVQVLQTVKRLLKSPYPLSARQTYNRMQSESFNIKKFDLVTPSRKRRLRWVIHAPPPSPSAPPSDQSEAWSLTIANSGPCV